MRNSCLIPASHDDDLANAMATHLRAFGIGLDGDVDSVETRVITFLISMRYRWADIKPRLESVIAQARTLGPINLRAEAVAA